MSKQFWQSKTLNEMSQSEWESLCDGCGLCCLHKLEDEDTDDVYYTNVACKQLDLHQCRCKNYSQRSTLVPDCLSLTPENIEQFHWLPATCAYRLLAEDKPLAGWHPLLSGNPNSVHNAGVSVRDRVNSKADIPDHDLQQHIIHWVK
ncbi:MAG: hypothetical protein COC05_05700 [Gammaproteobacteria bacterium]|nr:MAG: hypothetical protein COC05_05700 [Gammaproteobacteria bacterium]